MLTYYRYKVEKGMMTLDQVPQPYQDMLRVEMTPAPEPTPEPVVESTNPEITEESPEVPEQPIEEESTI